MDAIDNLSYVTLMLACFGLSGLWIVIQGLFLEQNVHAGVVRAISGAGLIFLVIEAAVKVSHV
jgi:hypothetical protein